MWGYTQRVIRDVIQRLKRFFERGERFLVVEVFPDVVRASLVRANFERKRIRFLKSAAVVPVAGESGELCVAVKRLLRHFPWRARKRVILALDATLATTVRASVLLMRPNPEEPIDEADLENRIAQGIWKLFDRERSRAAAKMKANVIEVGLTDVRVGHIKLDGHRVVNPVGFRAKVVELQFDLTFAAKPFLASLREAVAPGRIALLIEAGTAAADVVARSGVADPFLAAQIFADRTCVYAAEGTSIAYADEFAWGRNNLLAALSTRLGTNQKTSAAILARYLARDGSPYLMKRLEGFLLEELTLFAHGLDPHLARHRAASAYLVPFFDPPSVMFTRSFAARFARRVKLALANETLISGALGFDLEASAPGEPEQPNMFPATAGLLAFYFAPVDDRIDRVAKRHARWLLHG